MSVDLIAFLTQWQFWILELQFALVLATTVIEVPRLQIDRRVAVLGVLLGALAWGMAATVPPRTSRIYYDEQIYQGIGRSLADTHRAEMCNEGVVEYGRLQCQRGIYNKQPHAYPYLLSVAYRLAGVNDVAAFRLNNLATGLTVLATVCIAALLFGAAGVSLLAGVLMATVPMQLQWGNTEAVEPTAALFSAIAVLAALHYARVRTGTALAWVVAVTVFAMSFRAESILIAAVVVLTIVLFAPGELRTRRFRYGAAAAMAGAALPLIHLYAMRNAGWGTAESRMSLAYVPANLSANLSFYVADGRFPPLLAAGAIVALLARGYVRQRVLLGFYFLLFWGVFLFFYAGSYNYGADVRYSLMSYVPLVALAAAGLVRAALFIRRRWAPQVSDRMAIAALTGVVVFHFLTFLPLVRAEGDEAWAARADVKYAKEFAQRLPANAIVLTHNPSMFHVWGVNAAQLSLAKTDPAYVEQYLFKRFAGGVFVHWNFWCNVDDPVQAGFCTAALDAFPHQLVASRQERDHRYALYRLTSPSYRR